MKNNIWKQKIHLEPKKGWLNDPNGLVYFKGTYYIYHQYSKEANGGTKLWYCYESKDLINFKDNGVVLINDSEFDKSGVYSGSAYASLDEIIFYYTGNVKYSGNFDYIHNGREQNTIKVSSKDGKNFSKKICVLKNSDYPNMSNHVRDPIVYIKDKNEYLILGARDKNDYGCLLIYKNMKYYKSVYSTMNLGYMWECPNYFNIDNNEILIFSPQGISKMYKNFINTYQVVYSVIEDKIENLEKIDNFNLLDYGHDFYAPQIFKDEENNIVMISWMYVPDSHYTNPTLKFGYQNCLSIPRVLKYSKGKIIQSIHKSIKNLFQDELKNSEFIEELWYFEKKDGKNFEIIIDNILIKYEKNNIKINLNESGYGRDNREFDIDIKNIEIIFDASSIELFANDGEFVFSSRYYTNNHNVVINSKNYKAYKLKEIEVK